METGNGRRERTPGILDCGRGRNNPYTPAIAGVKVVVGEHKEGVGRGTERYSTERQGAVV
jgi:hypothetical protein